LAHVVGGVTSCGFDDARADLLVLSFPGRADVDLWLNSRGCSVLANGQIRADAGTFVAALDEVAKPEPPDVPTHR
jgi:hypothetical protein